MKNKIFLAFIFLLLVSASYAQTVKPSAKVAFRSLDFGKISVSKGKVRSTIDLSGDIAGCPYLSGKYKRDLEARGCAAPSASFVLVDATIKNNQTFLVVLSNAMGNCNVCGQCGASEAFAVTWLKLDAKLRVLDKKSVPIEYCLTNTSLVSPLMDVDESNNNQDLKLPFKNDLLQIDFEKMTLVENSEQMTYELSHLEYNRRESEKGFVIKTEKRTKSAIDNE